MRIADCVDDFSRLNRRMHNKSFTADNQATIVGGRNIGDEYFGADSAIDFADLDVVAAGALVRDVSADFDAYWNSASAYPAASLIAPAAARARRRCATAGRRCMREPGGRAYVAAVRDLPLVRELPRGHGCRSSGCRRALVSDDPPKVVNPPERTELHMLPRLAAALGKPLRELDLVSPYFVPTSEGTAALVAIARAA